MTPTGVPKRGRTDRDFGIMVSCYRGDLPLLRGCLASIRTTFPTVPICLVTHGRFGTEEFVRAYGVEILGEDDVDPRLRAKSYGYGLTKMVSFWHSPYETFMHIDADTVCWGDFTAGLDLGADDFVYNEPHEEITEFIQRTQYFDPDRYDPGFAWKDCPFFNSGVFIARRGILNLDEYLEILDRMAGERDLIFMDQGALNILVFRGVEAGRVRARSWPLQAVIPVLSPDVLNRDYPFADGRPNLAGRHRLLHWAGRKPLLLNHHPFSEPMTYYRLDHLRRVQSPRAVLGRFGLRLEEVHTKFTAKHGGSYARAARSKLGWVFRRAARKLGRA